MQLVGMEGGIQIIFWRWVDEFKTHARDVIPICWQPNKQPTSKKPQPKVNDKRVKEQMKTKLNKVRDRGYIKPGFVRSLIRFFAVPKGKSDIRMVYDGTASGFNESVYIPNFGLPTIETLLRGTSPESWMVDLDIGDMFLNFMLAEDARELVGIDITPFFENNFEDGRQKTNWERWWRIAMGLKVSPNHAIRAILVAEEYMKGNLNSSSNPFQTSTVRLNLPGTRDYTPVLAWYSLLDEDGKLASILVIYVDDERIHASSHDKAWRASHQVSSRESYLGIQDAARKRRPPSQSPGAWAGSIVRTNDIDVGKLISEERWQKTRCIIGKWLDKLLKNPDANLDTDDLRSDRGFLIYIGRTYPELNTFFKGIHLTIDGWRKNRDPEGWRIATNYVSHKTKGAYSKLTSYDYPKTVKGVPRLIRDLQALQSLTSSKIAPVVIVRSKRMFVVLYGFGDASGGGFGSSFTAADGIDVQTGTWNEEGSDKSSNFRELGNFVIRLEQDADLGKLDGAELFLFTDNSTAESAFHNGTSSSPTLFELVVRLKKLQLKHGLRIHLIHVSGTRMIAQGTDGISRGNMLEGVMSGKDMLSFIPINASAFDRSKLLSNWFKSWLGDPNACFLEPSEWFWKGQGLSETVWKNTDGVEMPIAGEIKTFIWSPPPCIADVAIEYLRTSIHRRPQNTHLFVCPKLMTYRWRKAMLRSCDFSFYVDCKSPHWNSEMHESLLVGVYLPLLPVYPWTFRRSKSVLELERTLQRVQKSKAGAQGPVLCKFLKLSRKLPSMQERMVWKVLSSGRIR